MENVRNRINVNLVRCMSKENRLRKFIARPSFAKSKISDDNLAAIHTHKTTLKLNHPVYVGMSILDLSKHLMYDYYYNHLKKKYGDNCNLLYNDTDSLLLEIKTSNIYTDMAREAHRYDFSNYPSNHFLYSDANKKVIGKFKDVRVWFNKICWSQTKNVFDICIERKIFKKSKGR